MQLSAQTDTQTQKTEMADAPCAPVFPPQYAYFCTSTVESFLRLAAACFDGRHDVWVVQSAKPMHSCSTSPPCKRNC